MNAIEQSKRLAAYQAVDNHVLSEHKVRFSLNRFFSMLNDRQVIGIGSGTCP